MYNIAAFLLGVSQKLAMPLAGATLSATGPAGVRSLNFCHLENRPLAGFQSLRSQILICFGNSMQLLCPIQH